MTGLIQVLSCVGVRHACRVSANDVEIGSSHHACSAVPLNLRRWVQPHENTFKNVNEGLGRKHLVNNKQHLYPKSQKLLDVDVNIPMLGLSENTVKYASLTNSKFLFLTFASLKQNEQTL